MLQFWRIIQAGSRNFTRNAWLSMAATAVMTVTLTLVVVSFITNVALTQSIKSVTDKIDVSVFLKGDVTQEQVDKFKTALTASSTVAGVTYVDKEAAAQAFRETKKNDPDALKALDIAGNTLPPSLQIKATDPNKLDDIIAIVNQPDNKILLHPTAPPSYTGKRKSTIDRIVSFSNFFKTIGLAASAIFIIISILIIFNTIRMAIFTRRDEIEIMKLVGATKWFIRGPFIIEAVLYGVIAAVVAIILAYLLLFGGATKLASYIDFSSTISLFQHYPAVVVGSMLLIGILIGTLSSVMAMSRYLKL